MQKSRKYAVSKKEKFKAMGCDKTWISQTSCGKRDKCPEKGQLPRLNSKAFLL